MIDTNSWKEFRLGDWFDVRKGKRLTSEEQEPGDTPYIGAIDSNNGVANHIAQHPIHEGNTISLSYNGSVGEAFYQPEPYWATDDVNALYLKACAHHEMNEKIGLFIATILRQEKYRFSYGRKWTLPNMRDATIKLPADSDGNPDWDYVETFMDGLAVEPITTQIKTSNMQLPFASWEDFTVNELFVVMNGKGITKDEIEEHPGSLSAVQSGEENFGVLGRIDIAYCKQQGYTLFEDMCLTVARSGTSGFVAFHHQGCVVGDSAKILVLRADEGRSVYAYLFLQTLLESNRYKYSYGRKVTTDGYKNTVLRLPVETNGNPDWQWMEDYMRSLPYSDRIDVEFKG